MPLTVQMAVFGTAVKHTKPRGKIAPHTHTAEKKEYRVNSKASNNTFLVGILGKLDKLEKLRNPFYKCLKCLCSYI